jgi:hypothetical protein
VINCLGFLYIGVGGLSTPCHRDFMYNKSISVFEVPVSCVSLSSRALVIPFPSFDVVHLFGGCHLYVAMDDEFDSERHVHWLRSEHYVH